MRVGITCYPTYGGSGIVATELGLELANRGHDVHFISYANPIRLDPGIPRIHYHEVEVTTYPLFQYPPYALALASRMAEVAECYSLDLLHVHYAIPHSISALLARDMLRRQGRRLPFITTLHGTDITLVGADRSYLPITRFSIEESDGVTAVSDYLREATVDFLGVRREIRVIKNFVNCEMYQPDPQRRREAKLAPEGEKVLIHLSNFRPVKRVTDCIRILAEVRAARGGAPADGGRRPGVRARRVAGPRAGRRGARDVHGQAEPRGAAASAGARAAAAERPGVVRAGRARGDGLRRAGRGDPRRRLAGAGHARRGRLSRAGRGYPGAGRPGDRAADRRQALSERIRTPRAARPRPASALR